MEVRPKHHLLVQVSLVDREVSGVLGRLRDSMGNLHESQAFHVSFLVVFQTATGAAPPAMPFDAQTVVTDRMSASNARNLGIAKALELGYEAIIFHDASVWFPPGYLDRMANLWRKNEAVMALIAWSDEIAGWDHAPALPSERRVTPDIFSHCYVWAYVFPVARIAQLRFDERLGPGRDTRFKCGEDVLFMHRYIGLNKVSEITVGGSRVFHPPRPKDLSKQLLYAEGQGALYRFMLREGYMGRCRLIARFVLFIGNGLRYGLLGGRVGRQVLVGRVRGFVKGIPCNRVSE
jgi:hypothetical protein